MDVDPAAGRHPPAARRRVGDGGTGDTLSQIAVDHGSTTDAVWQANHDRAEPDGDHFTTRTTWNRAG